MAAAAGEKSTTSLSLFMEAYALKWRRSFPPWHSVLGRRSLDGKMVSRAWMRQTQQVQTWNQVRGPAGVVMCETRDLGIKWPHWHMMRQIFI